MSDATDAAERLVNEATLHRDEYGEARGSGLAADILTVARALRSAEERVAALEAALDEAETNLRSLRDNLRLAGTEQAIGSDAWYIMMTISTLAEMIAALARPAAPAGEPGLGQLHVIVTTPLDESRGFSANARATAPRWLPKAPSEPRAGTTSGVSLQRHPITFTQAGISSLEPASDSVVKGRAPACRQDTDSD